MSWRWVSRWSAATLETATVSGLIDAGKSRQNARTTRIHQREGAGLSHLVVIVRGIRPVAAGLLAADLSGRKSIERTVNCISVGNGGRSGTQDSGERCGGREAFGFVHKPKLSHRGQPRN